MIVEIDNNSGFCFGVTRAIGSAERELKSNERLYCLGDIVHNNFEVNRLESAGLQTIDHEELERLHDVNVLLRAHGEPPSTYTIARHNHITIVDATCPVVLKLQQKIKTCYESVENQNAQFVIYGKQGHAEVNGLVGQTEGHAVVIENMSDLEHLNYKRPIYLFSQTTMSLDGFQHIVAEISRRIAPNTHFEYFDSICRQVSNRLEKIKNFAANHDRIYFVAGEKSSNGRMLFGECLKANPHSVFITDASGIKEPESADVKSVGVCGATSTPKWLMEQVAERIQIINCKRK